MEYQGLVIFYLNNICCFCLIFEIFFKESKPIHSFENNNDYVSSVAWSPVHPAVFAAIDVTGRLDLWNLNNNTESPTASTVLDNSPLLKSLMWSQNGTHLSVGDENGKISVFQVGEVNICYLYII